MKCAYCGREALGTKEHIISCSVLDLFPECYITYDYKRGKMYQTDPVIKDVCSDCNNRRISYIDSYAKDFISNYFIKKYNEDETIKIEYDCAKVQKMLLKYAYNDMRSHKEDSSFFDDELISFLLNEKDNIPRKNITVLCGLSVNVTPLPDAFFGNIKLNWCKNPVFFSSRVVRHIDYETGQVYLEKVDKIEKEEFPDLKVSYIFKFNSGQFILMCWDKSSDKIERNNTILKWKYPYELMNPDENTMTLSICTDEFNYHSINHIHVKWDGFNEISYMRKLAFGGEYKYKEMVEKEWGKEEEILKKQHPRKP